MKLLSDIGTESVVYANDNYVYKIFRKNYKLGHKTPQELEFLASLKTKRILMPSSLIMKGNELKGYKMPYIKGNMDILDTPMGELIDELHLIDEDIKLLSNSLVRLMDINKENTIFNGKLYLIDPGNYFINDIKALLPYIENKEPTHDEKIELIEAWNYDKLNKLLDELLFINNDEIDFYLLRKIIEFFDQERAKRRLKSNLGIFELYFDKSLTVRESINKFIKEYIKIDEKERQMIISLILK